MNTDGFIELPDDLFESLLQIELPDTVSKAGWYFDHDELIRAIREHGLKHPVKFRYQSGTYRSGTHYARYHTRDKQFWHRITINQLLKAESANETLWHELRHAIQSEKFAEDTGQPMNKFYSEGYKPAKGRWGASYMENTYELDARAFASKNKHIKLIKEV